MWHRSSRGTLGRDKVIISTDTTGHAAAAPPPSYFYTPVKRRRHDQQQKRFRSILMLVWQLPSNVNMRQLQNFFRKENGDFQEFARSCGLLNLVMKPFSPICPSKEDQSLHLTSASARCRAAVWLLVPAASAAARPSLSCSTAASWRGNHRNQAYSVLQYVH